MVLKVRPIEEHVASSPESGVSNGQYRFVGIDLSYHAIEVGGVVERCRRIE